MKEKQYDEGAPPPSKKLNPSIIKNKIAKTPYNALNKKKAL